MKKRTNSGHFRHPLTDVALALFAERAHDEQTLAWALGSPTRPARAVKGYRALAADLLGVLEQQGVIERDGSGWWRVIPLGVGQGTSEARRGGGGAQSRDSRLVPGGSEGARDRKTGGDRCP